MGKKLTFSNKSNDNLGSCKKICVVHKKFSLYICQKKFTDLRLDCINL